MSIHRCHQPTPSGKLLPIPEMEILDAESTDDQTGAQTDACEISSDWLSWCSDLEEAQTDACEMSGGLLSWCSDQNDAKNDAGEKSGDLLSWWYYIEMKKVLHILQKANDSAPFAFGWSSSSWNLQAVARSLRDGKYENNADLFWAEVRTCWDFNDCTFADSERSGMASEMRAHVELLKFDFRQGLLSSETCSDEDTQVGDWAVDSWVVDRARKMREWLFFGGVQEE